MKDDDYHFNDWLMENQPELEDDFIKNLDLEPSENHAAWLLFVGHRYEQYLEEVRLGKVDHAMEQMEEP